MPIAFRLESLQITNFPGKKSSNMAFPENATGVLIGANNACKPTLLNAIRLVLSGASTYNFVSGKYDFFHDAEAEPWHWALRSFQETQGVRVCSERPMRNDTSFFIVVG